MRATLNLNKAELRKVEKGLQAYLFRKKGQWRRTARRFANNIMTESQQEIPRYTGTMASTAYVDVNVNGDVEFGYGGPNDAWNPETKQMASEYLMAVHEDLYARHVTGKAKFLEDPIRRNVGKLELMLAHGMKD